MHHRVNGSKTQVAGWSTYTFLLWVVKAAMCTFYLRLTVEHFRTRRKWPETDGSLPGRRGIQKTNLCRVWPNYINLDRRTPLHSPRLPSIGEELADLPRSRQYVASPWTPYQCPELTGPRLLPTRHLQDRHLCYRRFKRFDRSLPHEHPNPHVLAVFPEAPEKSRSHCPFFRWRLCNSSRHSPLYPYRHCQSFPVLKCPRLLTPTPSPLTNLHPPTGPRQRRATSRLLGLPRDLRRGRHLQPAHDFPAHHPLLPPPHRQPQIAVILPPQGLGRLLLPLREVWQVRRAGVHARGQEPPAGDGAAEREPDPGVDDCEWER